jgi:curved DNA binding protein
MEAEGDSENEKTFIEEQSILDKYQAAAEVADKVIKQISEKIVPGADIADLCYQADELINEECKKVFHGKKTKKLRRGVAFPSSISANHILGNYSPLKDESSKLEEGDVAKVDLAVHIDGYIALSGHTVFVTEKKDEKVTGRAADVIQAAYQIKEAALRTIIPGNKNSQVTQVINKVAEEYKCKIVKGVFSHKLKKHVIDSDDVIASSIGQKVEDYEFHAGDVFGLEVFVSSGSGIPKQSEIKTTIYKRCIENTYLLKSDKARTFLKQVNSKYPTLPFSLRAFEDQTTVRIGVKHCMDHELIEPFTVVEEKKGEVVAHWKASVAILANGTVFLSGNIPFDSEKYQSEHKVENQELKDLLALSMDLKEQKKRKKTTKDEVKEEPKTETEK